MVQLEITLAILDDESIDRELTKLACKMCGIKCVTFDNEKEFLAEFEKYDGAILDYSMPIKNGVEIAEIMLEKSPGYPIIFRSNYAPRSKQHNNMLRFGTIISKDMKDGVLQMLKIFALQVAELKAERKAKINELVVDDTSVTALQNRTQ